MTNIKKENETQFNILAKIYKFRRLNCYLEQNSDFCFKVGFEKFKYGPLHGKIIMSPENGRYQYIWTSPYAAKDMQVKLQVFAQPVIVEIVEGTYQQLYEHPYIKDLKRPIIVLESKLPIV